MDASNLTPPALTDVATRAYGRKTDANGNAIAIFSMLKVNGEILSYRRYGENGRKKNVFFFTLFVHQAARGGTCGFTLKVVNTLI